MDFQEQTKTRELTGNSNIEQFSHGITKYSVGKTLSSASKTNCRNKRTPFELQYTVVTNNFGGFFSNLVLVEIRIS